jgi:hypothetical protein
MAELTLAEAEAELVTIKAALNEIYTGTRRRSFKVGSHEFERTYSFSDPADLLKVLLQERDRLIAYIRGFDLSKAPVFVSYATIPVVVKSY